MGARHRSSRGRVRKRDARVTWNHHVVSGGDLVSAARVRVRRGVDVTFVMRGTYPEIDDARDATPGDVDQATAILMADYRREVP